MKLWRAAAPTILERRFLAMGTEISVKLVCVSKTSREDAEAAITEVQQLMADFGRDWWAWGPGALAEINRQLVAGEVVRIPPNMQPLFNRAWSTRQMTEGFFEPRIAALVRLWGFDDVARLRSEPPAKAQIDALLHALKSAPAYAGGDQYGPAPDVAWDFGGIGKGYIIDVALAHLQARGFSDAVVDAGGNLAVRGAPLERSWRIGIRDPRSNPEHPSLLAALDVRDEAVITHGDDQRYFDYAGRRYAHILWAQSLWCIPRRRGPMRRAPRYSSPATRPGPGWRRNWGCHRFLQSAATAGCGRQLRWRSACNWSMPGGRWKSCHKK
jgi:thiamine biosynthesis lipoprotein